MDRIWLVSDGEGPRRTLADQLIDLGFRAYLLPLGQKELTLVWQERPGPVLLEALANLDIPRFFCQGMRRREEARETPLIAWIHEQRDRQFNLWRFVKDFIRILWGPKGSCCEPDRSRTVHPESTSLKHPGNGGVP